MNVHTAVSFAAGYAQVSSAGGRNVKTSELIKELRNIAEIGIVNHKRDVPVITEAADRLEEQEERIQIMIEGNGLTEIAGLLDPDFRREIRN